jgi:type VI secretion system secreted protein Hcp
MSRAGEILFRNSHDTENGSNVTKEEKKMNAMKQRGIAVMALLTVFVMGIAFATTTASAQTSTFMKVDGIAGSSTDAKHVGWINLASLGQAASNQPTPPGYGGQTSGRAVGACDVEVLKGLDAAGPNLWLALFKGSPIPRVTIEVWMTRPAGDQVKVYEVVLKNVFITNMTAASALTFAETVKMSGEQIELTAVQFNSNGTQGGNVKSGWNCTMNTRL